MVKVIDCFAKKHGQNWVYGSVFVTVVVDFKFGCTGPCSGIQQSCRGSSFTQPPPKLCEPSRHDVAERLIGGSFPRGAPQPPPFASVAPRPQRRCEPEWLNSCGGSLPTWR